MAISWSFDQFEPCFGHNDVEGRFIPNVFIARSSSRIGFGNSESDGEWSVRMVDVYSPTNVNEYDIFFSVDRSERYLSERARYSDETWCQCQECVDGRRFRF